MRILAIETSCDETGIAILETKRDAPVSAQPSKITVLADVLISQANIHADYGGVFPALARREHAKNILPLLTQALTDANLFKKKKTARIQSDNEKYELSKIFHKEPELLENFKKTLLEIETPEIDAIAVTSGPGLEPALWVGINTAEALSALWDIPVIPINHMEGHIMASLLTSKPDINGKKVFELSSLEYPSLALLISGGHTEIVLIKEPGVYEILGQTRDDAVGEAFDKVARMLGLPYPGGPEISKLAETVSIDTPSLFPLPRPMLKSDDYDFSFAGLKTAVLYTIKKIPELTQEIKASIAKEFEDSATEILIAKTKRAAEEYGVRTIILGGGVTANKKIRTAFGNLVANELSDIELFIPDHKLSTDNGLMIGIVGLIRSSETETAIRANGTMRLAKSSSPTIAELRARLKPQRKLVKKNNTC